MSDPAVLDLVPQDLPWSSVDVGLLAQGARRLEARSYLTDGYGQRRLIEVRREGWKPLQDVASVWQPSRLRGVVVREGAGLPFLSAGQVFEAAPVVRKWLAAKHVTDAATRLVYPGWILMSRSGRVGRVTAVYSHHQDVVITDDLLRIVPKDADEYGWIYAYMRTPTFGAMAETSKYGHMIKHLEPEHVMTMPIIMPRRPTRKAVSDLAVKALRLRQDAMRILHDADQMYERLISSHHGVPVATVSHSVPISRLLNSRRRLDAEFARADVLAIEELVRHAGTRPVQTVNDVCISVTLGSRFRRYFGPTGTPYRSASDLLDLNAPVTKRVYAALVPDKQEYILRSGWIIMACSGQIYGINGRCMLLTRAHDGIFGSHDLIRLVPDKQRIHPGYLQLALNNRRYGRPLVIRHAYGTSIPHLDPIDIRTVPIARFDDVTEKELGSLVVRAAMLSSEADELENRATDEAEKVIRRFVRNAP